jgi:SAM-dependent methyltransferase
MDEKHIDFMDYLKKYVDEHTRAFSYEAVLSDIRARQVLRSLEKYEHNNILEIGCGLNPAFLYCSGYDSYTVVEAVAEFCEKAKNLSAKIPKVNIIHGLLEEVFDKPGKKPEVDFIIMNSVLHEVPDPDKLLKSIYNICSPKTTVYIGVPNIYSFHRLLATEMGLIQDIFQKSELETRFQRQTQYDKKRLLQIVEKNGFCVLSSGTFFIKPFTNEQMERIIGQGIVDKSVIDGLEKMSRYMPELGCELFVEARIL